MKKSLIIIMILLLLVTFTGCKKKVASRDWGQETFFSDVEAPNGKITKLNQDYNQDGKETYTVIVDDFGYSEFYDYIMKLEKSGFHYEFVSEAVPKNQNELADKTETSWTANKGNIYIMANWKSNDNIYYDGYNLQLLFYNHNYLEG